MKIRNFIGKAISTILNMNRYENLMNDLLNLNFEISKNQQLYINNNLLHGVLDTICILIEKNNIFQDIKFDKFIEKITNFLNYVK